MKVKELIKLLSECPMNARVEFRYTVYDYGDDAGWTGWEESANIEQVQESHELPYGKAKKETVVVLS